MVSVGGLSPRTLVFKDARVAVKAASVTRNPWFSMAQRSRRNPLRRQIQGCRNESRLAIGRAPASNLSVFGAVGGSGGSRASRIDRSLPSLGHRFAQGHCGLPNGIPIPDHLEGKSQPITVGAPRAWMSGAGAGGFLRAAGLTGSTVWGCLGQRDRDRAPEGSPAVGRSRTSCLDVVRPAFFD